MVCQCGVQFAEDLPEFLCRRLGDIIGDPPVRIGLPEIDLHADALVFLAVDRAGARRGIDFQFFWRLGVVRRIKNEAEAERAKV